MRIVIDTNVLASAMLSDDGASRGVLRACLDGRLTPLVGQALLTEYDDVLSRTELFRTCVLTAEERLDLLHALLSVSQWVKIYFSWRPNLPDEADNHLWELAIAGSAASIVSYNHRHIARSELRFPEIKVVTPAQILEELK